jgi:threonine/homoserine/homoserine lactone efflux protein
VPDVQHLGAFLLAALVVAVVPGPGLLFVLARSLAGGRAAGLRCSAGTFLGGMVHVVAAAVGLSALIAASATAFTAIRLAGAAYLVFLGIRTIMSSRDDPSLPSAAGVEGAFRQGVLTEMLNPKTALFFLAFLPQFCDPDAGSLVLQLLVLGTVSIVLNTMADVAVALGAGRIGEALRARPRAYRRGRAASGGVLVALGVSAAVSGRG